MLATVAFAPFIQHYVNCPPSNAAGNTVREVLQSYFREHGRVRDFILNEHGSVRPKIAVYVDGELISDRTTLEDPVHVHAKIFVQALPLDFEYECL
jgi:hypothetical protein